MQEKPGDNPSGSEVNIQNLCDFSNSLLKSLRQDRFCKISCGMYVGLFLNMTVGIFINMPGWYMLALRLWMCVKQHEVLTY